MKSIKPLNNKQALYFLWATILNQSQNADVVLDKTLELLNRLHLNENFMQCFSILTYEQILCEVSKKPAIHRFPRNMAENLYYSVQHIIDVYKGEPARIFDGFSELPELKTRLIKFRGIGEHKAEVALNIFENFFKENNFTVKSDNCASLLFTLDKEIFILNSLKE